MKPDYLHDPAFLIDNDLPMDSDRTTSPSEELIAARAAVIRQWNFEHPDVVRGPNSARFEHQEYERPVCRTKWNGRGERIGE